MKKILLFILLSIATLNIKSASLGDNYNTVLNEMIKSHLQIVSSNTKSILAQEFNYIVKYEFQNEICIKIDYIMNEGFYKSNLIRTRFKYIPYEKFCFIQIEDNIISEIQLPYTNK